MKKFSFLSIIIFMAFSIYGQKVGTTYTPVVSQAAFHDVSQPLSEVAIEPLGLDAHHQWKGKVVENKFKDKILKKTSGTLPIGEDPAWQKSLGGKALTTPIQNFEGTRNSDNGSGIAPPDTDGDVGPNHYFQMCNVIFQIFDKSGNTLLGPLDNSTIWNGFVGPWTGSNDGDPIVLYDEQADRWLVSQFAVNTTNGTYWELVAISTTPDPTGSYYRYAFQFTNFPDYPKFGVWRDGYYLMVQHGTAAGDVTAAVLERDQMLIGGVADMVSFAMPNLPGGGFIGMLPSDNDGDWAPVGTPNYFAYFSDDAWGDDPVDRLKVWEFDVNWASPGSSTLALTQNLDTDPFDSYFGTFTQAFIGQPGTTQNLSALEGALMNRMQYRNFGTYETMVLCHTVDLDNGPTAGTRWYELRKPSGGSWAIYQQGTYAPGTDNYWMASIAMNGGGDIALGYSVSSETTYPSIRYTGRLAGDPLGTMTFAEESIIAGVNYQNGTRRWGDYSMMSVDPSDDETFWYTNEFLGGNGWSDWVTQIASFSISDYCTAVSLNCDEYIINVQIGTINNSSGCDNYIDYSALSTDVPVNYPQNITVSNSTAAYSDDVCGIWVDWNRDGDFDDTDETIAVSNSPGTGPYNATIAVPAGVTFGECTMRVRIDYNTTPLPCGTSTFGEVEDYTIIVAPAAPNTWIGAFNTSWHNDANWTLGHIPVAGEDVVIATAGFQPVRVSFTDEACDDLTIDPGANFEIYGFNLDVAGNLDNNGTMKFLDAAANLTAAGFSNIGGTVQMDNGTFTVAELTDDGVYGTWNVTNGSIILNQTVGYPDMNATLNMSGGVMTISDLGSSCIWGYSGATANVTMSGGILDFNCTGLSITTGHTITENITGGLIRTNGYFSLSHTDFTPTGGTIELYGSNDASISHTGGSIFDLNIDKGVVKSNSTLPETWEDREGNIQMMAPMANSSYPITTLNIDSDLTITSGDFRLNGQTVNAGSNVYVYGNLKLDDAADVLNIVSWLYFFPGSQGMFTTGIANIDFAIWLDVGCSFNTTAPNVINFNGSGLHGIVGYQPATIATINCINTTGLASFENCVDLSIDNLNIYANVAAQSYSGSNLTINNYSDGVGSSFNHITIAKSSSPSLISQAPSSSAKAPEATPATVFNNDVLIKGIFDVGTSFVTANAKFETAYTGELIVSGGTLLSNLDMGSGWNALGGQTTLSSGSIEFPLSNLQMYASTISGGTIVAGRSFYTPAPSSFMPTGGTVELVGSGTGHYVRVDNSAGNYFNDLTVSRTASIDIYTATPTRVNGNLLLNSRFGHIEDGTSNTLVLGESWTNNVGPSGFEAGNSTVIFNQDGGVQEVNGENIFNNVQQNLVGAGSNLQFNDANTVLGDMTLHHHTWINDVFDLQGTLNMNNPASQFTANGGGDGTIASLDQGGTVFANGGEIDFLDVVEQGIYGTVIVQNGTLNYFQDALQYPDINCDLTITGGIMNFTAGSSGCIIAYDEATDITMSGGELNFINNAVYMSTGNPFTENITGGVITFDQTFSAGNPAFTPTGGTIVMTSGNDANLDMAAGANFFNVEINKSGGKGASFQIKDRDGIISNGMKANTIGLGSDVDINGNFTVNGGSFNLGNYTANVNGNVNLNTGGTLSVITGGTLAMGDGSIINVNDGATMEVLNASVTRNSTGYYSFTIYDGGTIGAFNSLFEYMSYIGIYLTSGSLVDPDNSFDNCTLQEGRPGGSTSLMTIDGDNFFTANNVSFPANTWGSAYNIWRNNSVGGVTFMNATGPFAGEAFEQDANNRIGWSDGTLSADLTMMLEGPYNDGTGMMDLGLNQSGHIPLDQPFNQPPFNYPGSETAPSVPPTAVDWVLVQVRDAAAPGDALLATTLDTKAGFLLNDGSIVDPIGNPLQFTAAFTKNAYMVVYQRNHIGAMANYPMNQIGGLFTYDFTTSADKAYGVDGHKQIQPGVWGMYSGDGNANGTVGPSDKNVIWMNKAGSNGYFNGDFNLDSNVDNKDKNDKWLPNVGKGTTIP